MANSTASICIKQTVTFNRGNTFVFGSWVCTAYGAGAFQRHLTMAPNPSIGLVTLPEVITGDLTGKFSEISLYNQHADFESGSASNSNSTFPWPSHASRLRSHRVLTSHSMRTSHRASATLVGPMRRLSLHAGPARRSPPTTLQTPTLPPATTRTPPTSSTSDQTWTSPSPRTP
jgi:hypothetical protein